MKNPWALHVLQAQGYSTAMSQPDKPSTNLSDIANESAAESADKERQITGADQPDTAGTVPADSAQ